MVASEALPALTIKIILIGGVPTTGKSTIAQAVAKHFDLPWISTNQIRNIMRVVADRKAYPSFYIKLYHFYHNQN